MAASPEYKVYDENNEYRAAVKYAEDAAVLVSVLGNGATIRHGHAKRDTVWHEGVDGERASPTTTLPAWPMSARKH